MKRKPNCPPHQRKSNHTRRHADGCLKPNLPEILPAISGSFEEKLTALSASEWTKFVVPIASDPIVTDDQYR